MKRMNGGAAVLVVLGGLLLGGAAHGEPGSIAAKAADEGPPRNAASARVDGAEVAASEKAKVAPAASHCPDDMQEVSGEYCTQVEQKCLRWLDPDKQLRCAEFEATSTCVGKTVQKHFCIDRYEWPNKAGEKPQVMTTWYQARDACKANGKRLCGDSEWTLACEGNERLPYPYGTSRDSEACNIDKPHPDPDPAALADPSRREAEVARLWQGEASGARDKCVSSFGVHDMTGNVDEWVVNESGHPYQSGLKGGYWGPVRTRCRPMTTAHYEQFVFYQIGFRCCSDAGS